MAPKGCKMKADNVSHFILSDVLMLACHLVYQLTQDKVISLKIRLYTDPEGGKKYLKEGNVTTSKAERLSGLFPCRDISPGRQTAEL